MKKYRPGKLLATYLIVIGLCQLVLYSLISLSDKLSVLFYFDPRFGLCFLEILLRGSERMPALLDWISAVVIIVIGLLLFKHDWLLPVYFIAEFLMAAPSLISFLFIAAANLSPNHGFSVRELAIPIVVFIFVTVVPLGIGIQQYFSGNDVDLMDYIPK